VAGSRRFAPPPPSCSRRAWIVRKLGLSRRQSLKSETSYADSLVYSMHKRLMTKHKQ
jgi:hypothetical protein